MTKMYQKKIAVSQVLNQRISRNLKILLEKDGIGISTLCKKLEENGQYSVDRTMLSKIINKPFEYSSHLVFLVACADYFKVPVDALLSRDIEKYMDNKKNHEEYEQILDMAEYPRASKEVETDKTEMELENPFFIENPKSRFFRNYLQKYYCYYYSTVSEENQRENPVMEGTLRIYSDKDKCKAKLKINTKKYDIEGNPIYKIYVGNTTYCSATQSIHCIMREELIGECCYLIFRYSQVNYIGQACRMAEVLSTSSTPDKRYPVVHRMFLSRERIRYDDLKLILPQLCLNYSEIMISDRGLFALKNESKEYEKIVEELLNTDYKMMHVFKEKQVRDIAERYFSKNASIKFITKLRSFSQAYHYNKVSTRVDSNLWNILRDAGYYQEPYIEKKVPCINNDKL